MKILYIISIFMMLILGISPKMTYTQTLDQQLRQAAEEGILTPKTAESMTSQGLAGMNSQRFFQGAPLGIASLLTVPNVIEEVQMGYLSIYFPKGYGRNNLHFGIWNAIPFVVFDNNSLELRFGLIFEHRQVGFVPDDWINTTISGVGLPEINFLIPNAKTFLNFSQGTSQWRSTVLLTDEQINTLELYANNNSDEVYTVTHRFIDASTRNYLIGLSHKSFFKIMIQLYQSIAKSPQVKRFRGSDVFPAGAFFDELTIESVPDEPEVSIQVTEVEEPVTEYDYDISTTEETTDIPGEYAYEEGYYEEGEYGEEGYYEEGEYEEGYYEDEDVAENTEENLEEDTGVVTE